MGIPIVPAYRCTKIPRCHNFRITIATPHLRQLLLAYCFLARYMVLGFSLAEIYLGSWTAACGSPTASLLYERLRQRSRSPTWSTDLPWLLDCCRWQPHRVASLREAAPTLAPRRRRQIHPAAKFSPRRWSQANRRSHRSHKPNSPWLLDCCLR